MNFRTFFILATITFGLSIQGYSSIIAPSNLISSKKIETPSPGKNELMLEKMKWFSGLTIKDYEKLKGKRLNFFERISFKLNKHRVRQMLKHYDGDEPTTIQKISWCFKGLIFGPIALILGYAFARDEQRELIKWIWFGFAGWCVILAIVLLSI